MLHIVGGAQLRFAQVAIGVGQVAKVFRVAGFLIVGMIALRQNAINAMDGVRIGVGADLEGLVKIDERSGLHDYPL
jgi:hypothetical protein